MENKIEEKTASKIKNMKIAKASLEALTEAAMLVKNPITIGVAIAAGLGSILVGWGISNEEKLTPAIAR